MAEAIRSAPLRPSLDLLRRLHAGEADAKAEFAAMFAPDSDCFLCTRPVNDAPDFYVGEDPTRTDTAILAPLCRECMALPTLVRWNRTRKMLRAMFPSLNPRKINFIRPDALRRVRA